MGGDELTTASMRRLSDLEAPLDDQLIPLSFYPSSNIPSPSLFYIFLPLSCLHLVVRFPLVARSFPVSYNHSPKKEIINSSSLGPTQERLHEIYTLFPPFEHN